MVVYDARPVFDPLPFSIVLLPLPLSLPLKRSDFGGSLREVRDAETSMGGMSTWVSVWCMLSCLLRWWALPVPERKSRSPP